MPTVHPKVCSDFLQVYENLGICSLKHSRQSLGEGVLWVASAGGHPVGKLSNANILLEHVVARHWVLEQMKYLVLADPIVMSQSFEGWGACSACVSS